MKENFKFSSKNKHLLKTDLKDLENITICGNNILKKYFYCLTCIASIQTFAIAHHENIPFKLVIISISSLVVLLWLSIRYVNLIKSFFEFEVIKKAFYRLSDNIQMVITIVISIILCFFL
ncbi:unnamed protein product [Commensalibacter papalotli (ex Botero et al. 2024)]|uniref:DUF202 domain-containing protein n=1 Tax=Commensalibacter papalotli (ex Botero et al. 2024) TaxID=2972766 RepID=A0ABM9HKR0_9PROT|nr:unnamed protein product [Commensalibacter papalotli (ex Botero et al. 2024)]CAI3948302.1 unnamed protein product [Commensalibacter papalotli (ex Botero et al. 2024)]